MKSWLWMSVLAVSPAVAAPPEVQVAEVLRRGDLVTIAGEGPRGGVEEALRAVTAPPADDSGMWHITVFSGGAQCPSCVKLLRDFETAPELTCFVAAAEPAKAWAHFNVFQTHDQTQAWRVKQYRIDAVPTIVVQPPRSGVWGDPRTVVWQASGYDGRPKELNKQLVAAVRLYAAKMSARGYPKHGAAEELAGGSRQKPSGVDPPFVTPPRVEPFNPQVVPQWPPQPTTPVPGPSAGDLLTQLLGALLGGQGTGNFLILLLVTLRLAEFVVARTKTPVDDQVVAWLKQFATQRVVLPTPSPTAPPASSPSVFVEPRSGSFSGGLESSHSAPLL